MLIAVLAEVATREGDDVAAVALGAGADRVSHVDRGRGGGSLGSGAGLGGVGVRAHGDCGVVCSVICGKRVARWQSVLLSVKCWFLLWLCVSADDEKKVWLKLGGTVVFINHWKSVYVNTASCPMDELVVWSRPSPRTLLFSKGPCLKQGQCVARIPLNIIFHVALSKSSL